MNTMPAPCVPLTVDNTVAMSQVGHRLALGIQWRDALSQQPMSLSAPADLVTDLEAVGQRPCPLRLDAHGEGRHAIRHSGHFAKLLARALVQAEPVDDGDPSNDEAARLLSLRVYARRHRNVVDYQSGNDPRVFVPRRLAFMPILSGGVPPASTENIRQAWLWPGAAYPIPSRATVLRGCVQRAVAPGRHVPVPWARLVITRPTGGPADFAAETQLAHAHGDDRGEFLMLLGASAISGGVTLPAQVSVHLWVFLPPQAIAFDPARPLDSLPLEQAGTAALDDVLKGLAVPAGYVQQPVRSMDIKLGQTHVVSQADLVFS